MRFGSPRTTSIARPLLAAELLLCFLFPAAGLVMPFVAFMAPGELPPWGIAMSVLLLTTSLLSPFAWFLAFRFVVLGRRELGRHARTILGVLAAWTLFGNTVFVLSIASPGFELRALLLMAILPAVGAVQLMLLADRERIEPVAA